MPDLQVEHLTVQFHALKAVDDLSFRVRDGEFLAIIGPNGAGKSTLFNAVTGMVRVADGRVSYGGQDLTNRPPYVVANLGLCRTFQKRTFFPKLTVQQNLMTGMHRRVKAKRWIDIMLGTSAARRQRQGQERCDEIMEFLKLSNWRDTVAESLPYGKQRLLGIGIALAGEPDLLLLDEPVAGMNPQEVEEMVGLLHSLRGRVRSIVLVEHHMRVVMRVADRVLCMCYGRKLAEGLPKEIQSDPQVIEAYLGGEATLHG